MSITDRVFRSTKTYPHSIGLSCCFRQWRATSHCNQPHGYALQVKLTFQGELDRNGWVLDFGGLKPIKCWLEETFDHKWLIAKDDPLLPRFSLLQPEITNIRIVPQVGIEAFAGMIFEFVDKWVQSSGLDERVRIESAEVSEHEGNSAICSRK